jgi:tRNA modification GTPase
LFNALIEREAAIVAPVAGTTRDYLRAIVMLDGWNVRVVDTAGWEPPMLAADRSVSGLAQARSREQIERAILHVVCCDATRCADADSVHMYTYGGANPMRVWTKCDLAADLPIAGGGIYTSSKTGAGLRELRDAIAARIASSLGNIRDVIPATATRCAEALSHVAAALDEAIRSLQSNASGELVASDLRVALEYLGRIVGSIHSEDVLDRVFSRFCIGK